MGSDLEHISLSNIHIASREWGTREWANKTVEERATEYPEVTMFHRLPSYGLYCRQIRGLQFKHLEFELLESDLRPALICDDVKDLGLDGFRYATPGDGQPGIRLINTSQVFLRGSSAPPGTATLLQVKRKGYREDHGDRERLERGNEGRFDRGWRARRIRL